MEPVSGESGMAKEKYMCGVCRRAYSSKYNVYEHMRKAHNVEPEAKGNVKCPLCSNFAHSYSILRAHLVEHHNETIEKEVLSFPSMQEFEKWKRTIEDKTNSRYIHPTGTKRLGSTNKYKIYYTCHRSGFFKSKSTGRKKVKLQGSCKIDATCPSTIEAVMDVSTGCVGVTFWKNHVGHTTDVEHLTLTPEERAVLAEKIFQGASFDEILKDIQSSSDAEKLKRIHLIRKQDLRNIKRMWMSSVDSSELCHKKKTHAQSLENSAENSDSGDIPDFQRSSASSSDPKSEQNVGDTDDIWCGQPDDPKGEQSVGDTDNVWCEQPDEFSKMLQDDLDEESDSDPSDAITMHDKLELLVRMSSTVDAEDVSEVNKYLDWAIEALQRLNPEAHEMFLAHKGRKYYESQDSDSGNRMWIAGGHDSENDQDSSEPELMQNLVDNFTEVTKYSQHGNDVD